MTRFHFITSFTCLYLSTDTSQAHGAASKEKCQSKPSKTADMTPEHLSLAFSSPSTSNCRWFLGNLGRHPQLEGPLRAGRVLLPGCSSLVFTEICLNLTLTS